MTGTTLPASSGGYEMTRFNALQHGVLSRYTVLPWENADEYRALLAALVAEHAPRGPTEEHLVEELAGILWRSWLAKVRSMRSASASSPTERYLSSSNHFNRCARASARFRLHPASA